MSSEFSIAIPDGDLKHSRPDILDDHLKLWRVLGHRDGLLRPKGEPPFVLGIFYDSVAGRESVLCFAWALSLSPSTAVALLAHDALPLGRSGPPPRHASLVCGRHLVMLLWSFLDHFFYQAPIGGLATSVDMSRLSRVVACVGVPVARADCDVEPNNI